MRKGLWILVGCCIVLLGSLVEGTDTFPRTRVPDSVYRLFVNAIHTHAHDVDKEKRFLDYLRNKPWPDISKLKCATLYNFEFWMRKGDQEIHGCGCDVWFLPSEGSTWTILRPDFSVISQAKDGFVLTPQDPSAILNKVIAADHARENSLDSDGWKFMVINDDCSCGFPYRAGVYLANQAYIAASLGKEKEAESILDAAFEETKRFSQVLFEGIYNELAWQDFEKGLSSLVLGRPRAEVLAQWQQAVDDFPLSEYTNQLKDSISILKTQSLQNKATQRTSEQLQALPLQERIAAHIEDFQEINAVQFIQPGECEVVHNGDKTVASDAIVRIGEPAIQMLIQHLEDRRLTRSFGFRRNFEWRRVVLRVQDVAIRCIEAILKTAFYQRSSTSSYFSTESPELRKKVIEAIKKSQQSPITN